MAGGSCPASVRPSGITAGQPSHKPRNHSGARRNRHLRGASFQSRGVARAGGRSHRCGDSSRHGGIHARAAVGCCSGPGRGIGSSTWPARGALHGSGKRVHASHQGASVRGCDNAALALRLAAFTEPAVMSAPVPGQTFTVTARFTNRSGVAIAPVGPDAPMVQLVGDDGWHITPGKDHTFSVTLADDVALGTKPYYSRSGLQDSRYSLGDASQFGRPTSTPPLVAVARYRVNAVAVELRERSGDASPSCHTATSFVRFEASRGSPSHSLPPLRSSRFQKPEPSSSRFRCCTTGRMRPRGR